MIGRALLRRNPIPLGNSVAVEPEDETALDCLLSAIRGGRVRSALRVEHRNQRRQPDHDPGARCGQSLQQGSAGNSNAIRDYLRHEQSVPGLEIPSTVLMTL